MIEEICAHNYQRGMPFGCFFKTRYTFVYAFLVKKRQEATMYAIEHAFVVRPSRPPQLPSQAQYTGLDGVPHAHVHAHVVRYECEH